MPDDYPEHEKLHAVQDKSQAIHEFLLEFLPARDIYIDCTQQKLTGLIAKFLGLDEKVLEKERSAMLEALRG